MISLSGENSRVIDSILKEAVDAVTKEKSKLIKEHPVKNLRSALIDDMEQTFTELEGSSRKKYEEWFHKIIPQIHKYLGTDSVHEAFSEETIVDLKKLTEHTKKQVSELSIDDGKENFKISLQFGKLPDGTSIVNLRTDDYGGYGAFDYVILPSKEKVKDINLMAEEEQIKRLKKIPEELEFIKDPSEEVQLAAVNQDGFVIKFIKDPSEKVQLAAIKSSPFSIREIKNPSQKILNKAFELAPELRRNVE
jgi:hypothetical protein